MPRTAAGLLVVRRRNAGLELLMVHPGGPYFARRDEGVWSIPKGLVKPGEDLLQAALREFREELGHAPPTGEYVSLGVAKQGNKSVHAWAVQGDVEVDTILSNMCQIEWPPRSGRMQSFPEVDRACFFDLETAKVKAVRGQRPLLQRAFEHFQGNPGLAEAGSKRQTRRP